MIDIDWIALQQGKLDQKLFKQISCDISKLPVQNQQVPWLLKLLKQLVLGFSSENVRDKKNVFRDYIDLLIKCNNILNLNKAKTPSETTVYCKLLYHSIVALAKYDLLSDLIVISTVLFKNVVTIDDGSTEMDTICARMCELLCNSAKKLKFRKGILGILTKLKLFLELRNLGILFLLFVDQDVCAVSNRVKNSVISVGELVDGFTSVEMEVIVDCISQFITLLKLNNRYSLENQVYLIITIITYFANVLPASCTHELSTLLRGIEDKLDSQYPFIVELVSLATRLNHEDTINRLEESIQHALCISKLNDPGHCSALVSIFLLTCIRSVELSVWSANRDSITTLLECISLLECPLKFTVGFNVPSIPEAAADSQLKKSKVDEFCTKHILSNLAFVFSLFESFLDLHPNCIYILELASEALTNYEQFVDYVAFGNAGSYSVALHKRFSGYFNNLAVKAQETNNDDLCIRFLQQSCDHMTRWCHLPDSAVEIKQRIESSQLALRWEKIVGKLLQAKRYKDAISAAASGMMTLPGKVLESWTPAVSLFVKAKSPKLPEFITVTSYDALQMMDAPTFETSDVICMLEAELHCLLLKGDHVLETAAVITSILKLSSPCEHPFSYGLSLYTLGHILRSGEVAADWTPTECFNQAITVLEGSLTSLGGFEKATCYDLLAKCHVWIYILHWEVETTEISNKLQKFSNLLPIQKDPFTHEVEVDNQHPELSVRCTMATHMNSLKPLCTALDYWGKITIKNGGYTALLHLEDTLECLMLLKSVASLNLDVNMIVSVVELSLDIYKFSGSCTEQFIIASDAALYFLTSFISHDLCLHFAEVALKCYPKDNSTMFTECLFNIIQGVDGMLHGNYERAYELMEKATCCDILQMKKLDSYICLIRWHQVMVVLSQNHVVNSNTMKKITSWFYSQVTDQSMPIALEFSTIANRYSLGICKFFFGDGILVDNSVFREKGIVKLNECRKAYYPCFFLYLCCETLATLSDIQLLTGCLSDGLYTAKEGSCLAKKFNLPLYLSKFYLNCSKILKLKGKDEQFYIKSSKQCICSNYELRSFATDATGMSFDNLSLSRTDVGTYKFTSDQPQTRVVCDHDDFLVTNLVCEMPVIENCPDMDLCTSKNCFCFSCQSLVAQFLISQILVEEGVAVGIKFLDNRLKKYQEVKFTKFNNKFLKKSSLETSFKISELTVLVCAFPSVFSSELLARMHDNVLHVHHIFYLSTVCESIIEYNRLIDNFNSKSAIVNLISKASIGNNKFYDKKPMDDITSNLNAMNLNQAPKVDATPIDPPVVSIKSKRKATNKKRHQTDKKQGNCASAFAVFVDAGDRESNENVPDKCKNTNHVRPVKNKGKRIERDSIMHDNARINCNAPNGIQTRACKSRSVFDTTKELTFVEPSVEVSPQSRIFGFSTPKKCAKTSSNIFSNEKLVSDSASTSYTFEVIRPPIDSQSLQILRDLSNELSQCYKLCCGLSHFIFSRNLCNLLSLVYYCLGDTKKTILFQSLSSSQYIRDMGLLSLSMKIRKCERHVSANNGNDLSDKPTTTNVESDLNINGIGLKEAQPKPKRSGRYESCSKSTKKLRECSNNVVNAYIDGRRSLQTADIVGQLSQCIPEGYTVAMVTRVQDNTCISRITKCSSTSALVSTFNTDLGLRFADILQRNEESAQELDPKSWWTVRYGLNDQMQSIVTALERDFIGPLIPLLVGQHDSPVTRAVVSRHLERLHDTYGVAVWILQVLVEELGGSVASDFDGLLNVADGFKDAVDAAKMEVSQSCRKLCAYQLEVEKTCRRQPVILVLDRDTLRFPWEMIPTLQHQQITRMPSLHLLLAALRMQEFKGMCNIDPSNCYYVLNPEGDLTNTQNQFSDRFAEEPGWTGVTARQPSPAEYSDGLRDYDMFLYVGHGNGAKYLSGDSVHKLDCRAATLLMGCSSVRIKTDGVSDPHGMVLHYLLGGAPCVVGFIWTVTDKDADRFLTKLLNDWLTKDNRHSLPAAIPAARAACKLYHLVAGAAVVYGLPVKGKTL